MNLGGTIRLNKFGVCIIAVLFFILLLYITSSYSNESDKKNVISLKKLLIASVEAAIKGGKEVVAVNQNADLNERSKGKTKEGADEPVTNADKRSHCVMYYSLTHTFPQINVISEEESPESACLTSQSLELDATVLKSDVLLDEEVLTSDVTVWIDPLDATKEFTEKLLQYVTTMVCVAVKGKPVIGVIHFPFSEDHRTTWAWNSKGVSKDIMEKAQSKPSDDNISVIVSRSHAGQVMSVTKTAFGKDAIVIPAGGAGYKSLEVASRNVSAYIHTTAIKKWDICAGNAIIEALGGKMTTLKNEEINYSSSKVTNSDGLLATLSKHDFYLEKLKTN